MYSLTEIDTLIIQSSYSQLSFTTHLCHCPKISGYDGGIRIRESDTECMHIVQCTFVPSDFLSDCGGPVKRGLTVIDMYKIACISCGKDNYL